MEKNENGIDFDVMPGRYWDDITKINYLQRYIIVHSIIYYELNQNCITDKKYDAVCKQLVQMQSSVDESELKKTEYYYVMHDFDGSTGFDLCSRLNDHDKKHLTNLAWLIINFRKGVMADDV